MRRVAFNEKGRRVGDSHPMAKLTDHEVELVLSLIDGGMTVRQVADKFEVSKSCIWHIITGRRRCQIVTKVKVA
jgi:predicted transcriptional regulator